LTVGKQGNSGASSPTRAVWFGGYSDATSNINVIDYSTIATLGNAIDFGDLTAVAQGKASGSTHTRAVSSGGFGNTILSTIEYVTIATTGNATSFGNLLEANGVGSGLSNGHGGLQ
jgi:hypothetical protein